MPHDLEHDWVVVAPWWKWSAPLDTVSGRTTSPVIQKYDSANLVNEFLKHPQRCLTRTAEDVVKEAKEGTTTTDTAGRPRRLGIKDATGIRRVFDEADESPSTLKIFLDTHKRFYLVVCEVHCDASGFPKVARKDVCEAGFVVRRRLSQQANATVLAAQQRFSATHAEVRTLDAKAAHQRALHMPAQSALRLLMAERREKTLAKRRGFAEERLAAAQEALRRAVLRFGADTVRLQGWFRQLAPITAAHDPGTVVGTAPVDNVGVWSDVEEEPAALGDEASSPLYPLVPPPSESQHAGQFGTLYFGVLPTGSRDTDPSGRPRFDDRTQYEIRCFVKRHLESHAKGSPCPCPDGTFWSLPTEPYKLASQFDLIGTSHQPVIIQLPDLNQLAAQAKPMPGVGFLTPPGYPMITGDKDGKPKPLPTSDVPQICMVPIPLITIVAKFLFEIFLPVVMLAFGLFWMLKLKFCIPPEIAVDASISKEAKLNGRFGLEEKADFEATLDLEGGGTLKSKVDASMIENFGPVGADVSADWSAIALANMELDVRDAGKNPPDVTPSVQFEAEVAHA